MQLAKWPFLPPHLHLLVIEFLWKSTLDLFVQNSHIILIRDIREQEALCGEIDDMAIASESSKYWIPNKRLVEAQPYTIVSMTSTHSIDQLTS